MKNLNIALSVLLVVFIGVSAFLFFENRQISPVDAEADENPPANSEDMSISDLTAYLNETAGTNTETVNHQLLAQIEERLKEMVISLQSKVQEMFGLKALLMELRKSLEAGEDVQGQIDDAEANIEALRIETQADQLKLQAAYQDYQNTIILISNIQKQIHDDAMKMIENLKQ